MAKRTKRASATARTPRKTSTRGAKKMGGRKTKPGKGTNC